MEAELDRIEDNNIAVLYDDEGNEYNVPLSRLPVDAEIGQVFEVDERDRVSE